MRIIKKKSIKVVVNDRLREKDRRRIFITIIEGTNKENRKKKKEIKEDDNYPFPPRKKIPRWNIIGLDLDP